MRGHCGGFTPYPCEPNRQPNLDVSVEHVPPPFRHEPGDSVGAGNRTSQRLASDYNRKKGRKYGLSLSKRPCMPYSVTDMSDARMQQPQGNVKLAASTRPVDHRADAGCMIARPDSIARGMLTPDAILQDLTPSPGIMLPASFGCSIGELKSGLHHRNLPIIKSKIGWMHLRPGFPVR